MEKMIVDYGYGKETITGIEINRYQADDTLCIQLWCEDSEYHYPEPFATLTVCLDVNAITRRPDLADFVRHDIAFLDTNNNPWAAEFVEKYNLAEPTGMEHHPDGSFCTYPLYAWNLDELEKYTTNSSDINKM